MTEAFRPIADYGLLADCNSAALVDRGGSIDWLCMPRYDSDAIFARILDPEAGHWSIRPRGPFEVERRYLDATPVIESTFTAADGTVRLADAMCFPEGQRGHQLGLHVPHELVRLVEGVSGNFLATSHPRASARTRGNEGMTSAADSWREITASVAPIQ